MKLYGDFCLVSCASHNERLSTLNLSTVTYESPTVTDCHLVLKLPTQLIGHLGAAMIAVHVHLSMLQES